MDEETSYLNLISKINKWPIRAPETPTKTLLKILQEIFTPEEAYLLSKFDSPNKGSLSIDDIMERDIDPAFTREKVVQTLDHLYERGLLPRFLHHKTNKLHYNLLPMVIGIFEYVFSNSKIYSEDKMKKLARLFDRYYYEGFGLELGASNYPWSRVYPHDQAHKEVIKIDQKIEGTNEILPYEEVQNIIHNSNIFGVMPCSCRTEAEYKGNPCKHPIETCMVFDKYLIDIGMAREITKDEALRLLHKFEKKGLVHLSNNAQKNHYWICNCCSCSCGVLGGLVKLNNPHSFARSNFLAVIDDSKECNTCLNCIRLCPTNAIQHWLPHDTKEEKWSVLKERCIGCGVCSSNCPRDRIILQKIRNDNVEEEMKNSWVRMEIERFH